MSPTRLTVTTFVIVLGIYDLCAVAFGGVDASISRFFSGFATVPGVVFTMGYICGHFFGWMTPTLPAGVRARLERLRRDPTLGYQARSVISEILGKRA